MTLEEYRATALGKLKSCRSQGEVLGMLAERDLRLTSSQIADQVRKTFWEKLNNDLDTLNQETATLPGQAATTLSAVISAAQTVIEQYLLLLASEL